MKTKRVTFGLLVLLLLLALLFWRFLPANTPVANQSSVVPPAQPSVVVVETPRPASGAAVEMPKLPPVKAPETSSAVLSSPAIATTNDPTKLASVKAPEVSPTPPDVTDDLGEMDFTDDVPVVRTLASGDTVMIVPHVNEGGEIGITMLIETGSGPRMANAGLPGRAAIQAELTAAKNDRSIKIVSAPSIVTQNGAEANIALGEPGGSPYTSIRLTPKMSSSDLTPAVPASAPPVSVPQANHSLTPAPAP